MAKRKKLGLKILVVLALIGILSSAISMAFLV